MQSLAKRHEDRARRLAINSSESIGGPVLSVGSVALAYEAYATLRAGLGSDERLIAELDEAIVGIDENIAGGYRSLAEHPDGSGRTMAGIGVVNPLVVPAAVLAVSDGEGKGHNVNNDAAWGDTPPPTAGGTPEVDFDPEQGNINGQALTEQLGDPSGWGTPGTPKSADLDKQPEAGNGGGSEANS